MYMITIKTNTILYNFEGKPLKNNDKELTIGIAVSTVLAGKVTNPALGWVLGKKFATEKSVELTAEEVVFLKDSLEKNEAWLAIVTGQCLEILEGKPEAK